MAAKLTRLTHKIAIHLHLVAESCTICVSGPRRPVWKLLDTPSYLIDSNVICEDTYRYAHILNAIGILFLIKYGTQVIPYSND